VGFEMSNGSKPANFLGAFFGTVIDGFVFAPEPGMAMQLNKKPRSSSSMRKDYLGLRVESPRY
jgi:hypothetical protein